MTHGETIRKRCLRAVVHCRAPVVLALSALPLGGCAKAGAPSFEFFGAFFPAWMLCALAGVAGAGAARAVLVSPRLLGVMQWLLAVCTAVGLLVGLGVWTLCFR